MYFYKKKSPLKKALAMLYFPHFHSEIFIMPSMCLGDTGCPIIKIPTQKRHFSKSNFDPIKYDEKIETKMYFNKLGLF